MVGSRSERKRNKQKRKRAAQRRRAYQAGKERNIQASYDEKNSASLCFGSTKKHFGSPRRQGRPLAKPSIQQIEVQQNRTRISNAAYDFPVVAKHAEMTDIKVELRTEGIYRFTARGFIYDFYVCRSITLPRLVLPPHCNLHDVLKAVIEDVDARSLGSDSPEAPHEGIVAHASELADRELVSTCPPARNREGSNGLA